MILGRNVGAKYLLSQVPAFLQYVSNLRLCRLPFRRYERVGVFHRKTNTFYPSDHIDFPVARAHVIAKFKLDFTLLCFQMLSIVLRRSKKCLSPTSSEQSESQKTKSKPLGPRYRYEVRKSSPSSIHCSRPVQKSLHALGKSFVVVYLYFLCSTVFPLLRFWMSF